MTRERIVGHMGCSGVVFAVAMVIASSGCSSVRQSLSGLFGETPPPAAGETPGPAAARQGQTYYAAVEGLAVYAEASESSKVVGHLGLHEKVTRSRLERGYAYVTADESGLAGWVDNAKLIWRLPPAGAVSAPGEREPEKGEAQATPTSTPATQPSPPPTQPSPAQAPARPSPPPSQFNPF